MHIQPLEEIYATRFGNNSEYGTILDGIKESFVLEENKKTLEDKLYWNDIESDNGNGGQAILQIENGGEGVAKGIASDTSKGNVFNESK